MKIKIGLFFQFNFKKLFVLSIFHVLPLWALYHFTDMRLPFIQYISMGVLVLFQFAFFKERKYRNEYRPIISKILAQKWNRNPSNYEVSETLNFLVFSRNLTLILVIMEITIIMAFYGRFN